MSKQYGFIVLALISLIMTASAIPTRAHDDIVTIWSQAEAPAPPELVEVIVNPTDTALLILDIEELTCNAKRRPRCLETVSSIATFLQKIRAAGVTVIYSLTSRGTPDTILPEVKPRKKDLIVQASVNKFHGTVLDAFIREQGIKRVIICGTAAHGAVMHTATAAGQRTLEVILPVDGLSASTLYTEQAAVQLLKTGPGTRRSIKLTRFNMIAIKK
ncbi:isochorismatase family protein [Pseudodesulfovibrio sediminis]|uniref:Isochorismatase n=1 Tax=Pseudodesulfovibrio sediminis TaxID=2810563 RepID=A0ABN6EWK7_9BACT|nr:isochorismatase family protein [Pseudodesulfovibrio sediminis]BCS89644.1 isochorismatase [Pseudodesulfovibrio sediminis]